MIFHIRIIKNIFIYCFYVYTYIYVHTRTYIIFIDFKNGIIYDDFNMYVCTLVSSFVQDKFQINSKAET